MVPSYEVKCINKNDRFNIHERITHIGGQNQNGSLWKLSQQEAIIGIEDGKWKFFVHQDGQTVGVVVAKSRYGHKYLKTIADNETPDNLLSLFECRH